MKKNSTKRKSRRPKSVNRQNKGWLILRLRGALALFDEDQVSSIDPFNAKLIRGYIDAHIQKASAHSEADRTPPSTEEGKQAVPS